jgi:putative IMPACT (imprinted ancient) family translation regulator
MHGGAKLMAFYTKVCEEILLCRPKIMTNFADNDDDGETAAGGRLAHLLQILVRFSPCQCHDLLNVYNVVLPFQQEVNNVLVIVTRYFGGVHLGPDRFKHINQAARNALELGGFLDEIAETRKNARSGRK